MRRALLLTVLATVLTGCGATGTDRAGDEARLMLDTRPNAVHAGIYLADARGYTDAEGVDLGVEVPGEETDPVELLLANRIQFAVMGIHDLALAREDGADLVAVMALVQRTLTTVLAAEDVRSPRELQRRRVGTGTRRSDAAVLAAVVDAAGGRGASIRRRPVGLDGYRALLDGRVEAVVGSWGVEGVALEAERPRARQFRLDDFGAPRFPELLVVANRTTLQDAPALVQGTVTALRRAYREVMLGPEEAVGVLTERADGLERRATQAQLDELLPALSAGGRGFGTLDEPTLRTWAAWEQAFGITERRPDVAAMFAPRFARQGVIVG